MPLEDSPQEEILFPRQLLISSLWQKRPTHPALTLMMESGILPGDEGARGTSNPGCCACIPEPGSIACQPVPLRQVPSWHQPPFLPSRDWRASALLPSGAKSLWSVTKDDTRVRMATVLWIPKSNPCKGPPAYSLCSSPFET